MNTSQMYHVSFTFLVTINSRNLYNSVGIGPIYRIDKFPLFSMSDYKVFYFLRQLIIILMQVYCGMIVIIFNGTACASHNIVELEHSEKNCLVI